MCSCLTFDTPEMMRVLRFVGVLLAALDSVSCRMAVSATGSSPLERRLLSEAPNQKRIGCSTKYQKLKTTFDSLFCACAKVWRFIRCKLFHCRVLNTTTCTESSRSSAFLFYHVTPQLGADSTLHLLCKTLRSQDSLLEMGLPLTSDSTTGLFSVTSTLDGEHRGDSPAASQTFCHCRPQFSLSLALSVLQHTTGLLPFLQRFISMKCFYL